VAVAVVAPSPSPSVTPQGVTATVQLGGLPATAFDDSTGVLKRTAADNIASALTAGVAAACPACTVRVTRVVNSATGAVVFAGRRLQAAAVYTVSFFVAGAGAAAAAAGINTALVASQLSTSLGITITVTLPSTGGSNDGLSGGAIAGIIIAAVVVAALMICFYLCLKAAARDPAAPKAGLRLQSVVAEPSVSVKSTPRNHARSSITHPPLNPAELEM
jgi:hypothetical protein